MNAIVPRQKIASLSSAPGHAILLQRKCGCGGSAGLTGACAGCSEKRLTVQPKLTDQVEPGAAPPIVHEALRSPGQQLGAATRALMESRFGHDFSRVRVHTDARAAESARAVNALAYTVGHDIVFGEGQYSPHSRVGQRLIGHELVHVIQQESSTSPTGLGHMRLEISDPTDQFEQAAEQAGDEILVGVERHTSMLRSAPRNQAPRLWRQQAAPGGAAGPQEKIWYVLKPPDAICQGDSQFCWAAGAASWLRATGINPQATRDMLIVRFGGCLDDEGALPEADMDDVFLELGAAVTRIRGGFDYDFVRSELERGGHFLLFTGRFVGHTLVVYGVGVDPDGKPSRNHLSVFDPATCTHRNLAFSDVTPVYIGRRTEPGPIARCRT